MKLRMWAAVCKAARWYARGFVAAIVSLGNAELALTHMHLAGHTEDGRDVVAYAREGVAELEAWLSRFTVND